jgi:hypothetical protein
LQLRGEVGFVGGLAGGVSAVARRYHGQKVEGHVESLAGEIAEGPGRWREDGVEHDREILPHRGAGTEVGEVRAGTERAGDRHDQDPETEWPVKGDALDSIR